MEHVNIFKVSNINTTLKNLKEKIFGFMVLIQRAKKILLMSNGMEEIFYFLDQKDLELKQKTIIIWKICRFFVKIDINEEIESLNISNSAAIVFHHLSYLKKKS